MRWCPSASCDTAGEAPAASPLHRAHPCTLSYVLPVTASPSYGQGQPPPESGLSYGHTETPQTRRAPSPVSQDIHSPLPCTSVNTHSHKTPIHGVFPLTRVTSMCHMTNWGRHASFPWTGCGPGRVLKAPVCPVLPSLPYDKLGCRWTFPKGLLLYARAQQRGSRVGAGHTGNSGRCRDDGIHHPCPSVPGHPILSPAAAVAWLCRVCKAPQRCCSLMAVRSARLCHRIGPWKVLGAAPSAGAGAGRVAAYP